MKNLFCITLLITFSITSALAQCNNLVLDMDFNGNALDASGNANHGTVVGASLTDDRFGNPNGAYYFDGFDDKISIPDNTTLDLGAEFTIMTWVKPSFGYGSFKDNHVALVDKWGNAGIGEAAYTMSIHTGGYMEGFTHDGVTGGTYAYSNSIIPPAVWTYLVLTRSADNKLRYYINGILDKEEPNTIVPQNSYYPLQIGMVGSPITEAAYPNFYRYNGIIDGVKIYKCALSSAEISQLMVLSIDDATNNKQKIVLFPNPTNQFLNIKTDLLDFKMKIVNNIGECVMEMSNPQNIDIS